MNILITSAGRRVSLVKSFRRELIELFRDGKVYTADLYPELSPACNISDGSFSVPRVTSPEYPERLLEICRTNNIRLIIPTIDTELIPLSNARKFFTDAGIECLVSDLPLTKMCRDKRETHHFFRDHNIDHAKEFRKDAPEFPMFVKPVDGSSSINIAVIRSEEEMPLSLTKNHNLLFLQFLSPEEFKEFTLDLYYDKKSILRCVVPRERIEVRGGEVSKGITRKNVLVEFTFTHLKKVRGFRGCITLQLFMHKTQKKIIGIEINPRFGGGYPLSYAAGANFPKWIIEEYLLKKPVESFHSWEENLLMLRFDDEILIRGFAG